MSTLKYSSWDGVVQREIITDWEQPYAFAHRTTVEFPDAFFDRNRALGEEQTGAMKLLARMPMTVYEQAMREQWDDADYARWLNDPDNAAWRVWPGSV